MSVNGSYGNHMKRLQTTDSYSPGLTLASIDRAVTSLFCDSNSPLIRQGSLDFHVMPYGKDQFILSVVIPEGMIKPTSEMLESMYGMFKFTDMKKRHFQAEEKVHDLDEIQSRKDYSDSLTQIVVQTFDELLLTGLTIRQAASETNKALKGSQYSLTLYQVDLVLRKAGRLKTKKTE